MSLQSTTDVRLPTAMITGATSAIGAEFAQQLATRGHDVALVARRAEHLAQLSSDIERKSGVTATIHPRDLSKPDAARALRATADIRGLDIGVLINAAGSNHAADLFDASASDLHAIMRRDMLALTELCRLFGKGMILAGRGAIVNVVRRGGGTTQLGSAYASALTVFLATELHPAGVKVAAFTEPTATRSIGESVSEFLSTVLPLDDQ